MSAGNLQRVRERETKAGGEEARSKARKAWLKTEEEEDGEKQDELVFDSEKATARREER